MEKEEEALQIYGLWKWARMRQTEIGEKRGKTRSAICRSVRKFEDRLLQNSQLRKKLEDLERKLVRQEDWVKI